MTRRPGRVRRRLRALRGGADRAISASWRSSSGRGDHRFGGVLVDVGAALTAREIAADAARQAARAGADALAPGSLRQASPAMITANTPDAVAAATRYLTEAGITGGVVTASGRRVTVHATVHRRTQLLSGDRDHRGERQRDRHGHRAVRQRGGRRRLTCAERPGPCWRRRCWWCC
jgi:hypothetical protein